MLTIEEWYGIISLVADEDDKNLKKVFKKNKKSSWQTTSSMVRCKSCWQKRAELLKNEVRKVFQKNLKKFLTST